MNILIPMAGVGSRFKVGGYEKPKPLISVNGIPMIEKAVKSLGLNGKFIFIVRNFFNKKNTEELEDTLRKISPNCEIVKIENETRGSAETCLFAKKYIDNDEELVITNCDQIMEWSPDNFKNFISNTNIDGAVVTYETNDPKHSFIKVDEEGNGILLTEKNPISNLGLTGIHYWKKGKHFVESAENNISLGLKENNEFYVAPTYNYLINKGMIIKNYHLGKNEFNPVGTPEDLRIYIGKSNEFKKEKIKTIICDIDGTILKHIHKYSALNKDPVVTPGVIEKFDQWDSNAYKIILMTGRKESARGQTIEQLKKIGIPYDQLIMDAGNGQRYLINDKINKNSFDRSLSINVVTDEGFNDTCWEKLDL